MKGLELRTWPLSGGLKSMVDALNSRSFSPMSMHSLFMTIFNSASVAQALSVVLVFVSAVAPQSRQALQTYLVCKPHMGWTVATVLFARRLGVLEEEHKTVDGLSELKGLVSIWSLLDTADHVISR